jgi:predicted dehydrogenase
MSKIKFAVIGAGHIGKRHAEMVQRNEQTELSAMCDVRSREECGVADDVRMYSTPEEMLAKE